MTDIREVLRAWLAGAGLRQVAGQGRPGRAGGPPGAAGRAWPGVGSAGGLPRRDRGAGEGGPVGDQGRGAAGAPRRRGPVSDAAPVLRGAVRVRAHRRHGAGRRRGTRGWSASSTSATRACWPTQCPGPGAARRQTRPDCASKADLEGGGHGPYTDCTSWGLLTEWGYRTACVQLSRLGYRRSEPKDRARLQRQPDRHPDPCRDVTSATSFEPEMPRNAAKSCGQRAVRRS